MSFERHRCGKKQRVSKERRAIKSSRKVRHIAFILRELSNLRSCRAICSHYCRARELSLSPGNLNPSSPLSMSKIGIGFLWPRYSYSIEHIVTRGNSWNCNCNCAVVTDAFHSRIARASERESARAYIDVIKSPTVLFSRGPLKFTISAATWRVLCIAENVSHTYTYTCAIPFCFCRPEFLCAWLTR